MLSYWSGVATLTGIYLIATLGVSILVGFTGLFSLGHAGFMAIGAYGTALSIKLLHMPFFPACLMGILAAMLAGGLIGRATLRLKGDYFVIATLAIGECTKLLIENIPSITGGSRGLTDIPKKTSLLLVWVILLAVIVILSNFLHSKHGRNCIAVREEELAAKSIGIDVIRYKMLAFLISCALCGLAGGLLAGYMGYLYPTMFTMAKSNELTMTVILGGTGSLTGTILAGLVLIPLPEYLRTLGYWNHTCEDSIDKMDVDNLEKDNRVDLGVIYGLANATVLPYDFSKTCEDMKQKVEYLRKESGNIVDMECISANIDRLGKAVAALNEMKLKASELSEVRIRAFNDTLLRLSRAITNAFYTNAEKYDQDSYGRTILSKPLPLLFPTIKLSRLDKDTLEYRLLYTQMLRNRNRVADAVLTACEYAELFLAQK